MSLLLRSSRVLQKLSSLNSSASYASNVPAQIEYVEDEKKVIGSREIVGFGFNGHPNYIDRPDFPMPAIRYKEVTPDIKALREKEKGEWKKLTIEEKKQLYRASFCQTFAEMDAPTGEWKTITGCTLAIVATSLWVFIALKLFVYPKELPVTFTEERQQAQLQRMIDIAVDPIDGLSSKWDYEKNDWKK